MIINWGALALVAAVTVVAAIAIVGLFALGVAALTAGEQGSGGSTPRPGEATPTSVNGRPNLLTVAGYACMATAGLFVVYGLYLIIPQFH